MLNGKNVLITGGTGSFGQAFVEKLYQQFPDIGRVVVFSRDELKQFEMSQNYQSKSHSLLRFFIGDIRDKERLVRATQGIDIIIHAAALKQVTTAEYNPYECIQTNVHGAENVIQAALENNVEQVVALSTDKAVAPINLYGATKLCSDKLFVAANNIKGKAKTKFSVVRYGNVMGSRGSVVPFFKKQKKEGIITITDPEMTRFNITLAGGIELVFLALREALGGEIFIPKIPSYNILDVAKAIAPKAELKVVGIRPGEKIHEDLITPMDALYTWEFKDYFIIAPNSRYINWSPDTSYPSKNGKRVESNFSYNSKNNNEWLDVEQLKNLIDNIGSSREQENYVQ